MGFQFDSRSEVVWISKNQVLPNACCTCSLYTDNQVAVKHVESVTQTGKNNPGCALFMLTLFMHVFLGPLGWLLSVLLEGNPNKEKTKVVKKKSKIRVMQCTLCHATEPAEVIETRGQQFSFMVHPVFRERLAQAKLESDRLQ